MELHLGLVIFCPARFVFQNQKWPPPACESNKMLATTWGKFHMWHVCSSKPGTTIISSPKFECAGPTSYIFWTSLILCPPCFGFNTTPNVIFWFILKKKQKRILISKQVKTNSSGWHPICIEKRLMNSWSNCLIHNFRLKCIQKLPSLTTKIYPLPRHFCKMTFLFSRGGICDRVAQGRWSRTLGRWFLFHGAGWIGTTTTSANLEAFLKGKGWGDWHQNGIQGITMYHLDLPGPLSNNGILFRPFLIDAPRLWQ